MNASALDSAVERLREVLKKTTGEAAAKIASSRDQVFGCWTASRRETKGQR
jgi:hypothetical protein